MASPASDLAAGAPSLVRQSAFLRLWAARFMGVLAGQIQGVTIAWLIYALARAHADVKHASFAVGMVGLAQFLPLSLLTLTAGEMADRRDRKAIVAACIAGQALTAAAFAAVSFARIGALWPIYALAAAFGCARAFLAPATTALAPMLVPRELLPKAIAWNSLSMQAASITGPAIGGLICAVSPTAAFVVAVALYGLSCLAALTIRGETRPVAQPGSRWALVKEGLTYIWTSRVVIGAISLDLFAVLLGGATALLPVFARDVLQVGAQGFGLLRAGPSIGAAAVALVLAARPIRRHAGAFMFAGVAVYGAATVVFALSKLFALSIAALVVLGGADMLSVYVRQTLVQIVTPDPMRGRVAAVSTLFISASNELGEFESGVAARLLGPIGAALFGGLGALAVTGLWSALFPTLRKADRLT
ncbi:MFS transporter [Phenylobacterium montanum]|uniref:MFS transporter n=1 Tax=Phenylobacterium montanum TaxID=2823693 RepID=A0A975FXE8_9CAUL|nr:MFS transporter [Caulobacter sp. S6]QUD87238.1 MFS transporter [Caulobacter sp. S6]